jgi:hypothetical protein
VTPKYYYYFYFLSHKMYGATKKRIPKSKWLANVGHSSNTVALILHNSNLWSPRPRWHTQSTQKKEKLNSVFYFHCIQSAQLIQCPSNLHNTPRPNNNAAHLEHWEQENTNHCRASTKPEVQ